MPIARENNREVVDLKAPDIAHENGNDFVAAADAERATGQEIILDVGDEQRIMDCEGYHERIAINLGNLMIC